jgi:hypothetical protein
MAQTENQKKLLKDYLVVEGQNLKNEEILIIWRDGQSSDELNEFFKEMITTLR